MTISHVTIDGGTDDTPIGNNGDALKVDGSGVTQPVSGTVAVSNFPATQNVAVTSSVEVEVKNDTGNPVPVSSTTLATAANQTTANTSLASIDTKTPALGQALAAASTPVVLTAIQIAAIASAANQSTQITSLQLIDDVIGPVTPGTVATKSALIGGQYNSTLPTLTTTQQAALQANANGILYTDSSQAPVAFINRTDVSTTVSASGNSATFDTNGLLSLSVNFQVTAISGSGAYIQFHIQASDDGTNWSTYMDTQRMTATGFARYQGLRQSGRYYRFTWDVAGTTPSVTFNVLTTVKSVQTDRKSRRFFYSDIDLSTLAAVSSVFSADDCKNITVTFQRGADGGNNGVVQLFASIDSVIWYSVSGNLAANVSANNFTTVSNQSWPFYQLQVTSKTSAGTRVLDVQWNAN